MKPGRLRVHAGGMTLGSGLGFISLLGILGIFLASQSVAALPEPASALQERVRVSPRDPRYFELTDGKPWIPIGLNMIAPPGEDLATMEKWIIELANNGGNFIRIWLSNPYFDVEHSRSGEYDPAKAARIRHILDFAGKRGVRVKMCVEHFRHLGDGRQTWAAKPLHLVTNGGTATNIADFFDGKPSRDRFRSKLAWFQKQFGNHAAIFGWELWNEVNAVQGGDYMAWTEVMLPELRRLFPETLVMQSLGSFDTDRVRGTYRRLATMPGNDVAQVHRYLDLGAQLDVCHGPMDVLAADAVRELLAAHPQRPVLLAESGAVEPRHTGPFKLYAEDKEGVLLHDVLFGGFFAGAAGPGHIWHWDHYVARQNLWHHFGRFAEIINGIDVPAEQFQPSMQDHSRLRVYLLQGKRTALLWARDKQSTWETELSRKTAPERLEGIELALPVGLAKASRGRVYDPWKDQWQTAEAANGRLTLPPFARSMVIRFEAP